MSPGVWAVLSGLAAYFGTGLLLVFLAGGADTPAVFGFVALAVGIGYGVYVYRARASKSK